MSARDELPPCECVGGGDPYVMCRPCRDFRHLLVGITREELATMRAAVERCAELEAALARITAERDRVTVVRDEEKAELDALTEWTKRLEGKFQLACSQRNDAGTEAHGLRVQFAKVTAERDEARANIAELVRAGDSLWAWTVGGLRAQAMRDRWTVVANKHDERATPTEGGE